jgi:hypothetical protein
MFLNVRPFSPKKDGYYYPKYNTLLRLDHTQYNLDNQKLVNCSSNKIVRNVLNNHSLYASAVCGISDFESDCPNSNYPNPYITTLILATSFIFFSYVVSNKCKIHFFKVS